MSKCKPWQPRIRTEPFFNSFIPPTDWTRDLGANDRIELLVRKVDATSADLDREEQDMAA